MRPDIPLIAQNLVRELSSIPESRKALSHFSDFTTAFERRTRYLNLRAGLFTTICTVAGLLSSYFLTGGRYQLLAGLLGVLVLYTVALIFVLVLDHRLQTRPLRSDDSDRIS